MSEGVQSSVRWSEAIERNETDGLFQRFVTTFPSTLAGPAASAQRR